MAPIFVQQEAPPSPPPDTATVTVHALSAGHLTLPEGHFVYPSSATARNTVPSLSFLIQHDNPSTGNPTRIVFDLGLRRDVNRYSEPIRRHAATREPLATQPDVVKSLAKGGLTPDDIDYVIYSHVHWDHIGEPRDFTHSTFVVGHGATDLLHGTSTALRGGHSFFEPDLLPPDRTIELSDPKRAQKEPGPHEPGMLDLNQPWTSLGHLPRTMDVFQDGSLYIVDAPGHLPGHVNLLATTELGQQIYLAGDACHDRRIMTGEREIGEWRDAEGQVCCIHADRREAEETIERIRRLEGQGVEVIFAHDVEWEGNELNQGRFWGV
ncbi:hypothetical protein M8818_005486 [Zalaria obscura]|uniref:Uncharacterized protein n=1 Tax=Zalaria obscura TaxID=2024903 RepID=A0ACC3S931_9PEZI